MTATTFPKKLNLGIIGCGARLRVVLDSILKAAPKQSIRIAGVYDPSLDATKAFCERYKDNCRTYSSEEALVQDPEIDWIFIGSWNCHHARQAILALNAGKHVFCEKPLATSIDDCLAIRDAVADSAKTFAFGLVLRYAAHYQKMKEVIDSGAIGKIVSFEFNETLSFNHGGFIFGNWRRERQNAGSHVLEKCCHDLDLANWIVGALPVKVASFGGRDFFNATHAGEVERIGPNQDGGKAYSTWPETDPDPRNPFDGGADIFDNQVAILQYANGVRGTFHTNCNAGLPERRFYICGTEGSLRADLVTGVLELRRIGWNPTIDQLGFGVSDGHGGGDDRMGKAMVDTMLRGQAPLASVEEGIQSALVAFGIDQASDEGRVVDLQQSWRKAHIDPASPAKPRRADSNASQESPAVSAV